jgi:outer membrane receptor protein involved in Fe transport
MKWALTPRVDLRFTAGKGWRTPNIIIENSALLASNKTWFLPAMVKPEVSWNSGLSLVVDFDSKAQRFTWTSDLYYTWFEQQFVADRDVFEDGILFLYQQNASRALAVQSEIDLQINTQWGLRFAYKYLNVKAIFDGSMQQQTMVPNHRILSTFSWNTRNKRWQVDLTMNLVGSMRMPDSYHGNSNTPWYPYVFSQISHQWKRLKAYIGFENMLHYRQENPIHRAEDPWAADFDASMVWGPITGFNTYAGMTFILKHKK